MNKVISLLCGIIFGIGLTISSMTNPEKVLGFLNLFGNWDPSLIFVMIGGILISMPFLFYFKDKPLFAENFSIPLSKNIDLKLIFGASLFGMFRITKRPYKDNPESTFTPLPRNITPLGIELDPTTGAKISSEDKK